MKKMSKAQDAQRDTIAASLEMIAADVQTAVDEINAAIREKLKPEVDRYNAELESLRELKGDISGGITDYMSRRSQKWQQGDEGEAFSAWASSWNDFDAENIDCPDEIEVPTMEHYHDLPDLPNEPDLPLD